MTDRFYTIQLILKGFKIKSIVKIDKWRKNDRIAYYLPFIIL